MPIIQLLWTLTHPCEWKMATLEDIFGTINICSNPQDVKFDTKLGLPFDEPYEVQTPSDTLSILLTTSNEQRYGNPNVTKISKSKLNCAIV